MGKTFISRLNPLQEMAEITPEKETDKALAVHEQIDSLAELSQQLQVLRERVAVEARRNDLEYVTKLDTIARTVLGTLADNTDMLRDAVLKMLDKGEIKRLKELMQALDLVVADRERLLGFDETRGQMSKRKLRLQVVWKGTDGSSTGISVEADE
jgi:hypothetical protein